MQFRGAIASLANASAIAKGECEHGEEMHSRISKY